MRGLAAGAAAFALLFLAAPAAAQLGQEAPQKRLPALAPVREDGLTRALRAGRIDAARYALERATALFRLQAVRARYPNVLRADPRLATLILRDLVLRLPDLDARERSRAERLLARPTDPVDPDGHSYLVPEETPACTAQFCIHYVASTEDAPPAGWVPKAVDTVTQVWAKEVGGLAYRAPRSDASSLNNGGGPELDVYLANLGDVGLYGYCNTDDPNATPAYQYFDVSAYCVIDNDYLEPIFAAHTPLQNMRVTVAHEFFHAVQYAYDYGEDVWLMEGTAAWIEDEVYDAVNDNRQYLDHSPLAVSAQPLDLGEGGFQYGAWIYYRYLSERYGAGIVRAIWRRADGSSAGPDDYSLQAISRVLASRGRTFRRVFNHFSRVNRTARRAYDEGAAYRARPRTTRRWTLTGGRRSRSGASSILQLGAKTFAIKPGRGIGRRARLELTFDLPSRRRGSEAGVLVFRRSGRLVSSRAVRLNRSGDATVQVPFGRRTIGRIEVVLVNASGRYSCWQGTSLTCQGIPRDDELAYRIRARAL